MAKRRGNNEGSIVERYSAIIETEEGKKTVVAKTRSELLKKLNGQKVNINHTWQAQLTVGRDLATGKPKRLTLYGKTRKEVADKLLEAQKQYKNDELVEPNKISYEKWLDVWLWQYKKHELTQKSFDLYYDNIQRYIKPKLGKLNLQEIKTQNIQKAYNELCEAGYAAITIKHIHDVVKGSFKQAIKNRLLNKNEAVSVVLPKIEKKIKYLTVEEHQKLLEHLETPRLGPIYKLMLATGMRRGEVLALTWDDIDFDNKLIVINKSVLRVRTYNKDGEGNKFTLITKTPKTESSTRIIPIPDKIVEVLKEYKTRIEYEKKKAGVLYEDNNLLCCSRLGKQLEPSNFTDSFHRILKSAGIRQINLHALRHSFATRLLELEENPKIVADILGHSKVGITLDLYTHTNIETMRRAADKINAIV